MPSWKLKSKGAEDYSSPDEIDFSGCERLEIAVAAERDWRIERDKCLQLKCAE